MAGKKLPKLGKFWRYTVTLETEGGDRKLFKSVLLSEGAANDEYLELIRTGYNDAAVVVDKDAADAYWADKDKERKSSKAATRSGSH